MKETLSQNEEASDVVADELLQEEAVDESTNRRFGVMTRPITHEIGYAKHRNRELGALGVRRGAEQI